MMKSGEGICECLVCNWELACIEIFMRKNSILWGRWLIGGKCQRGLLWILCGGGGGGGGGIHVGGPRPPPGRGGGWGGGGEGFT